MNPMHGIVIDEALPVIKPLWPQYQSFDLICFISTSKNIKTMYWYEFIIYIVICNDILYESVY